MAYRKTQSTKQRRGEPPPPPQVGDTVIHPSHGCGLVQIIHLDDSATVRFEKYIEPYGYTVRVTYSLLKKATT